MTASPSPSPTTPTDTLIDSTKPTWLLGNSAPNKLVAVYRIFVFDAFQAEDRNDAIILRFYEAFGGQASANVKINFPKKHMQL